MRVTALCRRRTRGLTPAVVLVFAVTGCPRRSGPDPATALAAGVVDCSGQSFAPPPVGSFRHKRSSLIAVAASPQHSTQDVIALPGAAATVVGKFAYGEIGKDLEDEDVAVHLGRCDAWSEAAHDLTDDDGRTRVQLEVPSASGRYPIVHRVLGDGSQARSSLTVAPPGTTVVVFDLDGTLTRGDAEITKDVIDDKLAGDYEQAAYEGGPALTQAWASKGYLLVYLTGRPYWLVDFSRQWLAKQGYAPGHLHTTDRHRDVVPSEDGVGEFKTAYLQGLRERGYVIHAAYGNAPTDIAAYAAIGVPKNHTFIIGSHGGEKGTQPITDDYQSHIAWVGGQPVGNFGPK